MSGPANARLPDGRLHLQHGPIDLVIEAFGERGEVEAAYRQAWVRFQDILQTLVDELPVLRAPVGPAYPLVRGPVAKRMVAAVWPHRAVFITPMAAVAGAVAEEMREAMLAGRSLRKAYVNDGGDIALWLGKGESFRAGVVENIFAPAIGASVEIHSHDAARGIATSGWRGRSQSLGIADAVTVLARTASQADAAATLIANAVNVEHPAIRRMPACAVKEDSDLGELPVTVEVGELPREVVCSALANGLAVARCMQGGGLIESAYLGLQGQALVAASPTLVGCGNESTGVRTPPPSTSAHGNRRRTLSVPAHTVIERFLLHVLPKGFKRIRHYGLLGPARKAAKLTQARAALSAPTPDPVVVESVEAFIGRINRLQWLRCTHCGNGRLVPAAPIAPVRVPPVRGPP